MTFFDIFQYKSTGLHAHTCPSAVFTVMLKEYSGKKTCYALWNSYMLFYFQNFADILINSFITNLW